VVPFHALSGKVRATSRLVAECNVWFAPEVEIVFSPGSS
jgi:hypothetical protein